MWLSIVPYVGPVLQKRLLHTFGSPRAVYNAREADLQHVKGFNRRAMEALMAHRSLKRAEDILTRAKEHRIRLLTFADPRYPIHAKGCPESPILLYYRGDVRDFREAAAVVGTRRCSAYGKEVAKALAAELASHGVPVISGLAKGIDGYAHTACLREDGYTIAIVAGGADVCYPREHQSLYDEISKQGAVVSPYPPGEKPLPKQFVARNALISAWSTHVVIVEAGKKSGALTTAEFAKKHCRKLYAVPNRIDVAEGAGVNQLIRAGAQPYLDFASLGLKREQSGHVMRHSTNPPREPQNLNPHEEKVLALLARGPLPITAVKAHLPLDDEEASALLFSLELEGKLSLRGEMVKGQTPE